MTSVVAGLGIVGIALGFAAKDTLANVIAGFTILWDRPFRVGDRIEVDGSLGVVRRITLRTTRVTELAASSVNLELRIWIRDPKNELAMRVRYVERVKEVLDAVGIEIPFPQLTLHVAEGTPPGQAAETDAQNGGARRAEDGPRSPAE